MSRTTGTGIRSRGKRKPGSTPTPTPITPPAEGRIFTGALIRGETYGFKPSPPAPASTPYQDSPWDPDTSDLFELHAGKGISIIHYGAPWRSGGVMQSFFTGPANLCLANGSYPLLDWSPWEVSPSEVYPFTMAAIAAGTHDSYITTYAQAVGAWNKPLFLRPMWEMNGTWFEGWSPSASGGPSAANFVSAWQKIVGIFRTHAPKATFVWCPNVIDNQAGTTVYPLTGLWPGASYVDWVGIDGYAWGSDNLNKSFTSTFSNSYSAITALSGASSLPMMLGEWGCDDSATVVGGSKSAWLTDALSVLAAGVTFPNIRAAVYFNRNVEGQNWCIENGSGAQAAYAAGMANARFASAEYGGATTGP